MKRKEEDILGDLLNDLQNERERCESLEAQVYFFHSFQLCVQVISLHVWAFMIFFLSCFTHCLPQFCMLILCNDHYILYVVWKCVCLVVEIENRFFTSGGGVETKN